MEVPIPIPKQGERGDLHDRDLPIDALRLCQNMLKNDAGRLVIRPGYEPVGTGTQPGTRIMGLHYFRTAAGVDKTVAATKTGLFSFDGTDWDDITGGSPLTGGNLDHVRFQVFLTGGVYTLLIANGVDALKFWDGTALTYSDTTEQPGDAIDVKAAANRALALSAPFNIRISEFNDPQTWPTALTQNLVDSGDFGVGLERFNRTSVFIAGDSSQWIARAQSGSFPFRFEKIAEFPGPLSAAAIVRAGYYIYYLAEDTNVYRFDGTQLIQVGWPMKKFVEANMHYSNRKMTHGAFLRSLQKIFWFFPGTGQSAPGLGIFYDIRTGEMGRLKYGATITASGQWRSSASVTWNNAPGTWDTIDSVYPSWDSAGADGRYNELLGDSLGTVHIIDRGDGSDNGAAIDAQWEVPLKGYGESFQNVVPDTYEAWFKKAANSTTVNISVGTALHFMEDPTYVDAGNFDLNVSQRNDIDLTSAGEARFLSIKHSVMAHKGQVEHMGGLIRIEGAGVEAGPVNG